MVFFILMSEPKGGSTEPPKAPPGAATDSQPENKYFYKRFLLSIAVSSVLKMSMHFALFALLLFSFMCITGALWASYIQIQRRQSYQRIIVPAVEDTRYDIT